MISDDMTDAPACWLLRWWSPGVPLVLARVAGGKLNVFTAIDGVSDLMTSW